MDFLELAKKRYSCRKITDKKVEQEKLDKIIEAGLVAPTAVNIQPFKIFLLQSEKAKEEIHKATKCTFGADNFFIVGAKKDDAWVRPFDEKNFAEVDAAIVATHMMMEIEELGLATTWVGWFDAPYLKEKFPQLEDYELIAMFPVGYASETARKASRHFERKSAAELTEVI